MQPQNAARVLPQCRFDTPADALAHVESTLQVAAVQSGSTRCWLPARGGGEEGETCRSTGHMTLIGYSAAHAYEDVFL